VSFGDWFRTGRTRRFQSSRRFDPSLYLVTGTADLRSGADLEVVVAAAVRGGVTLVQLREKGVPLPEVVALARALKARLAPLGVPLVINDNAEAVLAADADGLHVGQDDMPPLTARMAIGRKRILGVSAGNLLEARIDGLDVADYVGAGPVYGTATKADAGAAIGPEGILKLRAVISTPLVAIGGVNADNAAAAIAAGADGVAVVSAICGAADPEAAARDIRQAVEAGRAGEGSFPGEGL
jgi:thiamine-phosphate pyrophosphorylase